LDNAKWSRYSLFIVGIALLALTAACDGGPTNGGGFGEKRNWAGNYLRIRLFPEQHPLLGEYSSRNAGVIQAHVEWAQQAGIDFFAVPWRGPASWGHETLNDYVLEESSFDDMSWCILYETPTILGGGPEVGSFSLTLAARDSLLSHLLWFDDHFFNRTNYLHLNGTPVIFLRHSRRITGDARIALNAMRIAYADSTGGEDIYLVGDEVIWGATAPADRSRIGAMDAITGIDLAQLGAHDGYPVGTGYLADLSQLWQEYETVISELPEPIPLIPSVMPGFNDRVDSGVNRPIIPRELTSTAIPVGGTYTQAWQIANAHVSDLAIVLLNSFNDWRRDTQIEIVADNNDATGTVLPVSFTGGFRYFPYLNRFVEATNLHKGGGVMLGAIYEVWYDNHPPD